VPHIVIDQVQCDCAALRAEIEQLQTRAAYAEASGGEFHADALKAMAELAEARAEIERLKRADFFGEHETIERLRALLSECRDLLVRAENNDRAWALAHGPDDLLARISEAVKP
jgi:hypothetical protein